MYKKCPAVYNVLTFFYKFHSLTADNDTQVGLGIRSSFTKPSLSGHFLYTGRCVQALLDSYTMNKELNLDFSGGPKSWFDLWHTHVDWDGKGNRDWKTRKEYLEQLLETFDQLKLKLRTYPHDFQLWIMIEENDSGDDGVYIHTKNPNADNFPIKVAADNKNTIKDKDLKEFLDSLGFERVRVEISDGDIYYLFDKGTGISLV